MEPKQPTAEETWEEIESVYRKITGMIEALPPEEKGKLLDRFEELSRQEVATWWSTLLKEIPPGQFPLFILKHFESLGEKFTSDIFYALQAHAEDVKKKTTDHFIPKPRMTARDQEVERLLAEGLGWSEILKQIRNNPVYATGGKGNKVTIRALKVAQRRRQQAKKA